MTLSLVAAVVKALFGAAITMPTMEADDVVVDKRCDARDHDLSLPVSSACSKFAR
jgi:hypothetical protein